MTVQFLEICNGLSGYSGDLDMQSSECEKAGCKVSVYASLVPWRWLLKLSKHSLLQILEKALRSKDATEWHTDPQKVFPERLLLRVRVQLEQKKEVLKTIRDDVT